jgi:hypothetical protein
MSWVITGTQKIDPDAAVYLSSVEAADGQTLEPDVRTAVEAFIVGCKADGIWSAIKASCILAGARTLSGALVPLVGTAPTNFNFVAGDYNRETGLKGDRLTKRLNSNRKNDSDPQTSAHIYCRVSETNTAGLSHILIGTLNLSGGRCIRISGGNSLQRFLNSSVNSISATLELGGAGLSRSESPAATSMWGSVNTSYSQAVTTMLTEDIGIFGVSAGSSDARLAFYSIGESLDLALLDARVTTLINAFAAAIP